MTASSCPACNGPAYPGEVFCGTCGASLTPTSETAPPPCARCGRAMTSTELFCADCGMSSDGKVPPPSPSDQDGTAEVEGAWDQVLTTLRDALRNDYDIERELGRGGMAVVYLGYERALRRRVAVKVMSPALMLTPAAIQRFSHEAWTMAALEHPNIARIYAVGDQPLHYFVMQFVAGKTLDQVFRSAGPLPIDVIQAVFQQVGEALAYAHRKGVVHRDIKPSNLMLDEHGRAIVMDFGIAKVADPDGRAGTTGGPIGTVEYMSPEQILSQPVSGASDQYSLGVVAYQLLTGRLPFDGPTGQVMVAHVQAKPDVVTKYRRDCPPAVAAAISRMLAKKPNERFADVSEAIKAMGGFPVVNGDRMSRYLEALATGTQPAEAPAGGTGRPRRLPTWLVRTAFGAVAVGALAGVAYWRFSGDKPVGPDSVLPPPPPPPPPPDTGKPLPLPLPPPSLLGRLTLASIGPMTVGDSSQVRITAYGPDGRRTGAPQAYLRVTRGRSVFVANLEKGLVVARDSGATFIQAQLIGFAPSPEIRVQVLLPQLAGLAIDRLPDSGIVGQRLPLRATGRDGSGRPLVPTGIIWSAVPSDRAVVEGDNLVLRASGEIAVSATSGSVVARQVLRVAAVMKTGGDSATKEKDKTDLPETPDAATKRIEILLADFEKSIASRRLNRLPDYRAEGGTKEEWQDGFLALLRADRLVSAKILRQRVTLESGDNASATIELELRVKDSMVNATNKEQVSIRVRFGRAPDWYPKSYTLLKAPPE